MFNILISMPDTLYRKGIEDALRRTGDFRVFTASAEDPEVIAGACSQQHMDILVMYVSVQPAFRSERRKETAALVRRQLPSCRIVILLDESVSELQTEGVKNLRQARLIDSCIYSSCTMEYLVDTLQTIV